MSTSAPVRPSRAAPFTPVAGGHVQLLETLLDLPLNGGPPMDEQVATEIANAIQSSDWLNAVRERAVASERDRVAIGALQRAHPR
jgi:hypothetical protein